MSRPCYGKVKLYKAVQLSLNNLHGMALTVRQVQLITDEVLSCIVHGLFEDGSLVLDKLGSFTIVDKDVEVEERPYDQAIPKKIVYHNTKFIREMLKGS